MTSLVDIYNSVISFFSYIGRYLYLLHKYYRCERFFVMDQQQVESENMSALANDDSLFSCLVFCGARVVPVIVSPRTASVLKKLFFYRSI